MTVFAEVLGPYLGFQGEREGGQEKVKSVGGQVSALGLMGGQGLGRAFLGWYRWQCGCQGAET